MESLEKKRSLHRTRMWRRAKLCSHPSLNVFASPRFKRAKIRRFLRTESTGTSQDFTVDSGILETAATVEITALVELSICCYSVFFLKKEITETLFSFHEILDLCSLKLPGQDWCRFFGHNSMGPVLQLINTIRGNAEKTILYGSKHI